MKSFKKLFLSFLFIFIMASSVSYGMGNTHYLKKHWYIYDVSKVRRSDITSITLTDDDDNFDREDYEYVWDLDNTGLTAYFSTDTDIVIRIPSGDILKADRDASELFSFYDEVDLNHMDEEIDYDLDLDRNIKIKSNLKKIENLDLLDTSIVEDMSYMFYNLNNVEELDLSNFNTAKVNNMIGMFSGMTRLKTLDLNSFNTENVTNMNGMFFGLSSINSIDVKKFDTKNVNSMRDMFREMKKIVDLDITNFDTSRVRDVSGIFAGCKNLKYLKIDNINLTNAEDHVHGMFEACDNLSYIAFNGVKLPKKIDYLFKGISTKGLNIYDIDTKNAVSMKGLFDSSEKLEELNVQLDTENVEDMSYMFANCKKLKSLYVYKFDTKKVKNMNAMFYNCKSLKEIDLKDFNTENVEDMRQMFANCKDLKKLDLSNFNTRKVKPNRLYEMLLNLRALEELDISNNDFILNYVDKFYSKNGEDYYSYYNLSLGDLSGLTKIKINNEIANRASDLRLIGTWKNTTTNNNYNIKYTNEGLSHFISGEYELLDYCKIHFWPESVLNMHDINFNIGSTLNTEADILKISDDNNVYYDERYIFSGWFLNMKYTEKAPQQLKIDKDTTLYARFELRKHELIFDTNGGTAIPGQLVEHNKAPFYPTQTPEKKNYRFKGWYKDKEFLEEFDFTAPITEDTIGYARYEFSN